MLLSLPMHRLGLSNPRAAPIARREPKTAFIGNIQDAEPARGYHPAKLMNPPISVVDDIYNDFDVLLEVKTNVKGNETEGRAILLSPAAARRLQQRCAINRQATAQSWRRHHRARSILHRRRNRRERWGFGRVRCQKMQRSEGNGGL